MSKGQFQAETGRYYNLSRWWSQEQTFTDLDGLLARYAKITGDNTVETRVHARLEILFQIETLIYAWFDTHRANLDAGADYSALNGMRMLMDNVQREHTLLIEATITHGHELWLPQGTSKRATRLARSLWQDLAGNQGKIQIHNETPEEIENGPGYAPQGFDAKAFRMLNMSSFARLLTGQSGRRLLRGILHGDQQVDIHPMHPAEYAGTPGQVIADPHGPGNAKATQNGPGGFTAATGKGTRLRMDPRFTDTQSADLDAGGNRILSPHFITLGHELIHGLHNARGENLANVTSPGFTGAGGAGVWKDMEEWATIAGTGAQDEITENSLRAEHGLTARHGHEGGKNWKYSIKVYSFWGSALDPIGHVFLDVTTPDARVVAGFSPVNIPQGSSSAPRRSSGEAALIKGVPGQVADEPESLERNQLTSREFKVSALQATAALGRIAQDKGLNLTYRTFGLNCATWAVEVLQDAGQDLPLSWFSRRTPISMWSTALSSERRYT
jgi:hypothetical protein